MREIIGEIIILAGLIFIFLGIAGIFRFKNFYARISIASLIDTVGFLFVMTGIVVRNGVSWMSIKILLVVFIVIIINPVVTHSIAKSAYFSGYRTRNENECRNEKNEQDDGI